MTIPSPPRLADLPAGYRIAAGLTWATVLPDCDFETYSEAGYVWDAAAERWACLPHASQGRKGLPIVGAAAYTEHPTCEVLSFKYNLKDGRGAQHWRPGLPPPTDVFVHLAAGGLIEAWNVSFERWVWVNVCVPRYGWPPVAFTQWRCAMAKARAHSMPGALDVFGRVADLTIQKDPDGKRLLDKFSVPRNPTQTDPRTRIEPLPDQWDVTSAAVNFAAGLNPHLTPRQRASAIAKHAAQLLADHADTQRLYAYNQTDIESEAEASSILPDLSPAELRYWQDDQAINRRGVRIDMDGVRNCITIIEQAQRRYGDELHALTGCKPTELKQLQGWLHGRGVHLDAMDEDAIDNALTWPHLPQGSPERRALEIRSAMGSASVKKVYAMRNRVTRAGRLHDMYVFHGAHTGRPTGEGVQSTNLPKAGPDVYRCPSCKRWHGAHTMWCHWCNTVTVHGPKDAREWNPEAMFDALAAISYRSLDWLQALFGDAMLTIAGCLRGLFIASEGCEFVSSDFTAIEGVVIAALAGEQWRLDVFAGHGKIYEASAASSLGIPLAEILEHKEKTGQHHPARALGKYQELACGFGGWINGWKAFKGPGTDDEIKENILKWRDASPALVHLWGGQRGGLGHDRWERRMFGLEGMAILAVQNPGVAYPVHRLDGTDSGITYLKHGDALYCRVPSGGLITYQRPRLQPAAEEWRGLALWYEGWNTNPKMGPVGWVDKPLYAGRAAENVTQKVARDKQMGAIARLQDNGYPIVMHTYDENVADVPRGFGSVEELEALMTTEDPWNVGWPIKAAGGWRGERYRKG